MTVSAPKTLTRTEPQPISLRQVALSELHMQSFPRKHVAAGALIMCPEQKTESLYFIVEGRIRLYRLAPTGEEVFQGELGPGDCLKCPRVLCQHECHTFAEAMTDSALEVLPTLLLAQLIRESATFNRALMRDIANQMVDLDQRFYETSILPMKVRLHAELLRISRRRNESVSVISPPPTHQELANRIGSQREAVSKELTWLAQAGVIKRSRAAIHLLQEDALRKELADWLDDAADSKDAMSPIPRPAQLIAGRRTRKAATDLPCRQRRRHDIP